MYPASCRFIPFWKQLTCTVRTTAFAVPVKNYHIASSSYIFKNQPNTRLKRESNTLNSYGFRQLSLSSLSRNISSNVTTGVSSATAEGASISSGPITNTDILLNIPAPPEVPEISESVVETVISKGLAEPAFTDIGLGGYWPSGLVQSLLEIMHVSLDLPWWSCITIGVVTIRLLLFPLVIKAQKNNAKMSNNMPQLQILQQKMSQARLSGNQMQAGQIGAELQMFMKEKDVNPFRGLILPLVQAPIFMSFFFALKGMSNAPVESMTYGGLFWFSDLTVCDPYYLLPVLTSFTLWVTIQFAVDAPSMGAQSPIMRYVFQGIPVAMLLFTINFSGAILWYWLTTNIISLIQVSFLRIPSVRTYFEIPPMAKPSTPPGGNKGFMENVKEAWNNQKVQAELQNRQSLIESNFKRAGTGPVQKTYSYDPTRQKSPTAQSLVQRGFKQANKK